MNTPIYINGFASVSSLGSSSGEVWNAYLKKKPYLQKKQLGEKEYWLSPVSAKTQLEAALLKRKTKAYQHLDLSVILALLASQKLVKSLASQKHFSFENTGVNIGSSRGATHLFEEYHKGFLETGAVPSRTSPSTTLGNVSSWVAQDLGTKGAVLSHSITCSTALHGILNAVAWLSSGMATHFVAGGTEAPLTAFTMAQLEALKLYTPLQEKYPCRSLDLHKGSNALVLGEAASLFALSTQANQAVAEITGVGYANEQIEHSIAISADAKCFQQSMKMALLQAGLKEVDALIMHAPGTKKGDLAEYKAIEKTFAKLPFLTTNKWKIGHTYGASGGMSLEMGLLMLQHQKCIENPLYKNDFVPQELKHIMVNAVGFGGNAVSLIVSKL